MYGESSVARFCPTVWPGLSPRVRGIPDERRITIDRRGSIPACTGNPGGRASVLVGDAVYPRVYGESPAGMARRKWSRGLSPRVRGIPRQRRSGLAIGGSIPACTGNPGGLPTGGVQDGVYPRVYGESPLDAVQTIVPLGLSPRVRGIPDERRITIDRRGSIPACTGNPTSRTAASSVWAVYPRVYGESPAQHHHLEQPLGLSPRVRGIRPLESPLPHVPGSIPACTGNPYGAQGGMAGFGVYPRVYGESRSARSMSGRARGLSPRVRGIRAG